jgi:hypothetical protein
MKIATRIIHVLLFMVIAGTAFAADLNRFSGSWKNTDQNTRGIVALDIRISGKDITIRAWGKCSPKDCDWGSTTGYAYASDISSNLLTATEAFSGTFKTNFNEIALIIRSTDNNELDVVALTRFTDNSKRNNYQSAYVFRQALPEASGGDCLPYDPANLRIKNEGAKGWLLTDGTSRMQMLDNEQDAKNALAIAKRFTSHCFIGRDNTRTNRADYIVMYWEGDSGLATQIAQEDCISYNPENLRIVNEGSKGWLLTDGAARMLVLDNEQDARAALAMAKQHTSQCFIGRDNHRPDRKSYIVQYWK